MGEVKEPYEGGTGSLSEERKQAEDDLDRIEMKLRRI